MFIRVLDWLSSSVYGSLDGRFVFERQLHCERGTFAQRGCHIDRPAEQMGEALRERQAKPGSSIPSCRRTVGLTELVEHVLLRISRDSDPGVVYAIHDPVVGERYACNDLAAFGELCRVAE